MKSGPCDCNEEVEVIGFATVEPDEEEGGVTPLVRCVQCGRTWWRT